MTQSELHGYSLCVGNLPTRGEIMLQRHSVVCPPRRRSSPARSVAMPAGAHLAGLCRGLMFLGFMATIGTALTLGSHLRSEGSPVASTPRLVVSIAP